VTSQPLKPGWQWVKFGDVVRLNNERCANPSEEGIERYVGLEHLEPGDLRVRSWGNVADGTTFTNYFRPGQVLFGKRRAYQRKVAVANFEGVCSGDIYVLEPKDSQLLPELLPFICQTDTFFEHAIGTSAGSLSPRTNWKSLADWEFALPPLEEQKRIVATLRAAKDVTEAHHSITNLAQRLTDTLSTALFQEVLTSGVPLVCLSKICLRQPQSGLYKPKEAYGSGVPMAHMNELFGNDVITDHLEMPRVQLSEEELSKYTLTDNDLLFGRRSIVLEGAGRCVLVKVREQHVSFESSVLRVTIDPLLASSDYVFEWFRSPHGLRYIRSITTFTTVAGVKGTDVARLKLPLPSLKVQSDVATRLHYLRKSFEQTGVSVEKARKLLGTLIQRTLTSGMVSDV
jgi:type I restriction enzyme, S subunit